MSTAPTYKPLEIEVTDFGPIAKAKLDLRPLTVFVGPSNTGKSYLATLIYALHRLFGGYTSNPGFARGVGATIFEQSFKALGGEQGISKEEYEALDAWMDRLCDHARVKPITDDFCARLPDDVAPLLRSTLTKTHMLGRFLAHELTRCLGNNAAKQLVRHGSKKGVSVYLKRHVSQTPVSLEPVEYIFTIRDVNTTFKATFPQATPLFIEADSSNSRRSGEIQQLISYTNSLRDHQEFTEKYEKQTNQQTDPRQRALATDDVQGMQRQGEILARLREARLVSIVGTSVISPLHRTAHYLPASRTGLMQAHRVVAASSIQQLSLPVSQGDTALPTLSGVLADFLEQLVTFRDPPWKERKHGWLLAATLEEEVLKGQVHESRSPAGYPVFSYRPVGRKEIIPLMQASSMVSELAPVVLYLRHAVQPGDVLIIEEPEAHLHPAMQAAFTRQLAAAVRAGVRVMITTHSDYVVEELANLVRMSELPEEEREGIAGADVALTPEEVGVWLFEPKKRPKGSVVKEIPLDADVGLYATGYGDVTEALYNTSVEIDSRIGESRAGYESR